MASSKGFSQFRANGQKTSNLPFAPSAADTVLLEGCTGEDNSVTIKQYTGPCQPQHAKRRRYSLMLGATATKQDSISRKPSRDIPGRDSTYESEFLRCQSDKVQQSHTPEDGALNLEIQIGKNYFFDDPQNPKTTVEELREALHDTSTHMLEENVHGRTVRQGAKLFRSSFVSYKITEKDLMKYVKNNHWIEETIELYKVYYDLVGAKYNTMQNVAVIYDKNMIFKEFQPLERKYLNIGYYRADQDKMEFRIVLTSTKSESNIHHLGEPEKKICLSQPITILGNGKICTNQLPANTKYKLAFVRHDIIRRYRAPSHGRNVIDMFSIDIIDTVRYFSLHKLHPGQTVDGKHSTEVLLKHDRADCNVFEAIRNPEILGSLTRFIDDFVKVQ